MQEKICIVGMGYVGLPLAVELSKHYSVTGFDISPERVDELKRGIDRTNEVVKEELAMARINYTTNASEISDSNFIIVAVPTPIDQNMKPDLTPLKKSSETVGKYLRECAVVVYESTVYPGATEEVCVPILENESGMKCGQDFWIGYSPERVNPGDREHSLARTVKVVSAMDNSSLQRIADVYSKVTTVFKARNIKSAEAAKVIENVQRDLNIALMNELSLIFNRMGIDTRDVLEAAGTKWNFNKYTPGLVGGHCIGVDPYYLTHKALELGYHPEVILAGRKVNEYMSKHVAELVAKELNRAGKVLRDCKILIMGISFKEDVPDVRNSKAKDVIKHLKDYGIDVAAYDPLVEKRWFMEEFGVEGVNFENVEKTDCVIVFSPHKQFKGLNLASIKEKMNGNPILIDIKGFYDKEEAIRNGFVYKRL